MVLMKRLMLALVALVIATPALANEGGAPLLLTVYRPPARAATPREQLTVPTTMTPPGTSLGDLLSDHPPANIPVPALDTRWASTVPAANRKLANCLALTTEWNADLGVVSGSLENRCDLSLRIRATYGFRNGKGACEPIDRADGVLMPGFGRRKVSWQGSDDRSQIACIATIEQFGVPQWSAEQARAAQAWLITEARGGFMSRFEVYDKDGATRAAGSGEGKITAAQGDQPCELNLSSPDFARTGDTAAARQFTIHWADVARVQDVSYNWFVMLVFKDAIGSEGWSLNFNNFLAGLPATGFDGTVAASILSEYCRAAEVL
jgi:hypothetical protein